MTRKTRLMKLGDIVQEEDKSIQKIIAKLEELRESGELPGIEDE